MHTARAAGRVALTGAKADERHTLLHIITTDPDLAGRTAQTLIADKNYYGRQFEATLPVLGISLLLSPLSTTSSRFSMSRSSGPRSARRWASITP